MKQFCFIASTGYSGSTLLDMLLGANSNVCSVGEILKIAHYFGRPKAIGDGTCTCGERLSECPFWLHVLAELKSAGNHIASFAEFPCYIMNERSTVHRFIPTVPELLLVLGSRHLWRLAGATSKRIAPFYRAARNAIAILDAVSRASQSDTVIDASKHPFQMKAMYFTDPNRMKIVFLVRDGRAVSLSDMTRNKKAFPDAVKWWVRKTQNLKMMMSTIPKSKILTIRYEDICRKPNTTLDSIAAFLGISLNHDFENFLISKGDYHSIGGNPMKWRRDERRIQLDERWRTELTRLQLAEFQQIGGALNSKLGYHD